MRRTILRVTEARAFTVVSFAVILAVMLWVAATAPPTTLPSNNAAFAQYDKKQIHYFALGDSVASGHGLETGRLSESGPCRRTPKAYPWEVNRLLKMRYQKVNFPPEHHLACTGATAGEPQPKDLRKSKYKSFRNQVDEMLARSKDITADPILVSITIGANDFEFADPNNLRRRLCKHSPPDFDKWVRDTIMTIKSRVTYDVTRLLSKPNVVVVVTEYYNPLNKDPIVVGALAGKTLCPQAESRFAEAIKRINSEYVAALKELSPSRVEIAKISGRFVGHEAPRPDCGRVDPPKEPWIQGQGRNPGLLTPDCFHPNEKGAKAIGNAVDAAAQEAGLKRNGFILLLA